MEKPRYTWELDLLNVKRMSRYRVAMSSGTQEADQRAQIIIHLNLEASQQSGKTSVNALNTLMSSIFKQTENWAELNSETHLSMSRIAPGTRGSSISPYFIHLQKTQNDLSSLQKQIIIWFPLFHYCRWNYVSQSDLTLDRLTNYFKIN